MRPKNLALFAKLNWRLYAKKDTAWSKVILSTKILSAPASRPWFVVKKGEKIFKSGTKWECNLNTNKPHPMGYGYGNIKLNTEGSSKKKATLVRQDG